MTPTTTAFNHYIAIKDKTNIINKENAKMEQLIAKNKIKTLELEKLENQITISKQTIEIETLNDNIKLLESAQISAQSFEKILELALLQTNIKQTLVKKNIISQTTQGWGIQADYYNNEALVVIAHNIDAKFGIDLSTVKIAKLDENTVNISGITPKFIGAQKNLTDTIIKEIRRNNYKNGVISSVVVQNDTASLNLADKEAKKYENEFQIKLSEGVELEFMNDAVNQLAQNFIKVMLAPLYRNIKFDNNEHQNALPFMEYLKKELQDTQDKKNELLDTATAPRTN
jgi:hypothetical protein